MPQTREHLAILDILHIDAGVIVLTKVDLVPDVEWLDLVEEDIRSLLHGTALAEAPIVRVSARTGEGLPQLMDNLSACLSDRPPRPDLGRPRLPVDRIFSIAGFGTVVTGTLMDGELRLGDEVHILGSASTELRGRIRGLQTHKRKEDFAVPGSRTAVNITGVAVDEIQRGSVVVHPNQYQLSRRLDVRFRLLPDVSQALEHNTTVKLFIGAAEVLARLRLLGMETLPPGSEAWLQLELDTPVVAVRGDRYILRRPSPGETLGGGIVVDPQPKGRHKRFAGEIFQRLQAIAKGTPEDVLLQALLSSGIAPLQDVLVRSNLDATSASQAVQALIAGGQMVSLESGTGSEPPRQGLVAGSGVWQQFVRRAVEDIDAYHQAHPLRKGMGKEELKSRLKANSKLMSILLRQLVEQDVVEENGPVVLRKGHQIQFTPQQQKIVDGLLAKFSAAPFAPPSVKDCLAEVGEEVYNALIDLGLLAAVPPDVVFRSQDYEKMVAQIRSLINQHGAVTAAQVRDYFNTSRRYVLAVLEYLDTLGITIREGDYRRLRK
jgi:selenocysteine-specific elongation factor